MWEVYFVLNKPARFNAKTEIEGVTVQLVKNSQEMIVTNLSSSDQEQAIKEAQSCGNIFLDQLSWKHNYVLSIVYSKTVIHTASSGTKKVSVVDRQVIPGGTIEFQIIDSAGNIIADSTELGTLEAKRSEAASFYRRGCLSIDPFDKFRNYYLVVENISDKLRLKTGYNKSDINKLFNSLSYEQNLLQFAMDAAFGPDLRSLVENSKKVINLNSRGQELQQIANTLYVGYRCQLHHAKATKDKKIPFNPDSEKEVQTVLPLMEFIAKSLLAYEDILLTK